MIYLRLAKAGSYFVIILFSQPPCYVAITMKTHCKHCSTIIRKRVLHWTSRILTFASVETRELKKKPVFWVVRPCSLVEVNRRFGSPCCLHHQGDVQALMIEAVRTFANPANFYQTTRCYNQKTPIFKITAVRTLNPTPHVSLMLMFTNVCINAAQQQNTN
jgi:hypothetical protein